LVKLHLLRECLRAAFIGTASSGKGTGAGSMGAGPPVSIRSCGRCSRMGRSVMESCADNDDFDTVGGETISSVDSVVETEDEITWDNRPSGRETCPRHGYALIDQAGCSSKPGLRLLGIGGTGGCPSRVRFETASGAIATLLRELSEGALEATLYRD
jgi:hypothetical protein